MALIHAFGRRHRLAWLAYGLAVLLAGGEGKALEAANDIPRVFAADPQVLMRNQAALAAGTTSLRPALNDLLARANALLDRSTVSVMDKVQIPPSGDKHDYVSQAP